MSGKGSEMEDLLKTLSALEVERDYYRQVAERLGRKALADAQDFSQMIRELRQREMNLHQSQEELEKTIEQRTAELLASNAELRESTLRYDSLVKRIPYGVYTLRVKESGAMHFEYLSPPLCRILDIDPEEIQGNASLAFAIAHPDDRARLESSTREATGRRIPFRWEGRFTIRQEDRWIRLEADPTATPAGDIVWNGVVSDITERRHIQDRLQESEERLHFLVKNSSDSLVIINSDGSQRFISPAAERITGYPIAELQGRTLDTLVHPDDMEAVKTAWKEAVNHPEKTVTVQYRHIHKTRGWVFSEAIAQSFLAEPATNGVIASVRDITEHKRVERFLRDVINKNPMSIQILDQDGLTLEVNPSYTMLFGSVPPFDYSIFSDLQLLQKGMGKLFEQLRNGAVVRFPDTYFNAHDSISEFPDVPAWIRTIGFPLNDSNEKPERFVLMHENISEQKLAEKERERLQMQLTQAQKMEAIGQLAGGVAHDFNNMLGVIIGYSEMLLEQVNPSQQFHAELEEIQKAAHRSADLTRQLLTFARKQTVAPRVLDLNQTLEGMLSMLRRLIGENINLIWMPGNGLWSVKLDPSQIDQILANLCVNARDAIAGVGKITVATENTPFNEEYCAIHAGSAPGEYVRIAVSDTGNGMDKETLAHIFEPFFTTKGVGEGTGLGLATVYGAVKQNNGYIYASSEPGRGTTFTIYIPRYTDKVLPAVLTGAVEPITSGTETILLVEDEPMILKMTTHMLVGQGYHVLTAASPWEAIRLAKENAGAIDLLLTDVIMPEMNGHDLAKHLLNVFPNIKRLFMSGYTANVIEPHGVLDEGVHFIQKPFNMKDLAAAIREALAS